MASSSTVPRYVTPDELAEILRTTRRGIYGRISRGTLPPPFKFGRNLRFDLDEVLKFISESRGSSPTEE
ncbi:MAG: helix-turn-helix domain-containing protein [Anaeromyxobacteraceae bacterium]|nr:helix-turn-helix domain-containing protein [Anaeromyxobacteraceae bacterium]